MCYSVTDGKLEHTHERFTRMASDLMPIDTYDIANFLPTKKQEYAKYKLHQFIDPGTIGKLTVQNIGRVKQYFDPITESEILDWAFNQPGFWQWFVVANEQQFALNSLKPEAVKCIGEILKGNVADAKLASTQLKAAQLLLSMSDKPSANITQNTMNIRGTSEVPKMLAKKTTGQIQDEILKLKSVSVDDFEEGEN